MSEKLNSTEWSQSIERFRTTRRNLPHMQSPGSWYFTASNTHNRQILSDQERAAVLSAIRFHDGTKYEIDIAVVMPDHFHLLFIPLEKSPGQYYSLEEIFHSIKSYTAHQFKRGRIWQDENYDHLIRDERDFWARFEYILYNPVEAGIVERPQDYPYLYIRGK